MSELPTSGTWTDGDEVVMSTAVYKYFSGSWYKLLTIRGFISVGDPVKSHDSE